MHKVTLKIPLRPLWYGFSGIDTLLTPQSLARDRTSLRFSCLVLRSILMSLERGCEPNPTKGRAFSVWHRSFTCPLLYVRSSGSITHHLLFESGLGRPDAITEKMYRHLFHLSFDILGCVLPEPLLRALGLRTIHVTWGSWLVPDNSRWWSPPSSLSTRGSHVRNFLVSSTTLLRSSPSETYSLNQGYKRPVVKKCVHY